MKKSKMLISLILVAMLVVLFFSVNVNAAVSIKSANSANSANGVANNGVGSVSAANVTNVSNYANQANNVANYVGNVNNVNVTNTSNSSKLPKTGAADMTGVIVLGVIFVGVAAYTYKKVTDYNV
jgi:LPXTG-motif cell wall-anchored protein